MSIKKSYLVLILLFVGFTQAANAAGTTTLTCKYPAYSNEDGYHKSDDLFTLQFLIDTDSKKAYVIGNAGSSEVMLVPNNDGLTLIEVTGSGNVMTTAIAFKGGSVHSRAGIILGKLIPSQYYGTCSPS